MLQWHGLLLAIRRGEMYYAIFKDNGERITTYIPGINCDAPPEGAILISEEDQELYATNQYIRDATTGKPILKPPYIPTKTEQIVELNAEYDAKINLLKIEYAGAGLANSTPETVQAKQLTLIQQRTDLLAEKAQKRSVILNG